MTEPKVALSRGVLKDTSWTDPLWKEDAVRRRAANGPVGRGPSEWTEVRTNVEAHGPEAMSAPGPILFWILWERACTHIQAIIRIHQRN